jgi:hypothetical protein
VINHSQEVFTKHRSRTSHAHALHRLRLKDLLAKLQSIVSRFARTSRQSKGDASTLPSLGMAASLGVFAELVK